MKFSCEHGCEFNRVAADFKCIEPATEPTSEPGK